MASIQKRVGKNGAVSYKIVVCSGTDSSGKQVRRFMTWKPDPNKTARQNKQALTDAARNFEREIEQGFIPDNRQNFEAFANHYIELMESRGKICTSTVDMRRLQLRRVAPFIGYMKLSEVKPQHLDAMYTELLKPGCRIRGRSLKPKSGELIKQAIKEHGFVQDTFFRDCGANRQSIYDVCGGLTCGEEIAGKIANTLNVPIESLFDYLPEKGYSTAIVRGVHNFCHVVFEQAKKERYIQNNPADYATPPSVVNRPPQYLQPDEIQEYMDALQHEPNMRTKAFIMLLLSTGLRRGEASALTWEKVDIEKREILIDRSASRINRETIVGPTKTRKARIVPIPDDLAAVLTEYKKYWYEQRMLHGEVWPEENYLFVSVDGTKPLNPGSSAAILHAFTHRHNLPDIYPHALRHTFASILIGGGIDVKTTSEMLGHATTRMTLDRYTHMIDSNRKKVADSVNDALFKEKIV